MRLRLVLLLVFGVAAYWNAMSAPFLLDDDTAITKNESIRQLSPLPGPFLPPADTPVARRPIVNLTLAANYSVGGLDPRGYRLVNLAIHLLATLVLFAIVRRTLTLPAVTPVLAEAADGIATVCALVWLLHPLNTEVVDYVTQRSESLMGLAYLLTLYCAIRAWAAPATGRQPSRKQKRAQPVVPARPAVPAPWVVTASVCCAAGVLCKESMVTAPIAVALYDRTFLFDSFREGFDRRRWLYAGLAVSWVLLAVMMLSSSRTTVGFGAGISPMVYALNQVRMIARYLYLSVWPRPLVVDYGVPALLTPGDVVVPALILLALAVATVALAIRHSRFAFGALWFALTLAPTSTVVPIVSEVGAERRMYLPLAGLVVMAVTGGFLWMRRAPAWARYAVVTVLCLLAAAGTFLRNQEYRDRLTLARTVVERWPNGRGRFFLGSELAAAGRHEEAIGEFRTAARDYHGAHYALGVELVDSGRTDEGLGELREFIRFTPADPAASAAHDLIGNVLLVRGQFAAAEPEFTRSLALQPRNVSATVHMGDVRFQQGRAEEAIRFYQDAQRIDANVGNDPGVLSRLGVAQAQARRLDDAAATLGTAASIDAANPRAHKLLGRVYAMQGRFADASRSFKRAVDLAPADAEAREFLAAALDGAASQKQGGP